MVHGRAVGAGRRGMARLASGFLTTLVAVVAIAPGVARAGASSTTAYSTPGTYLFTVPPAVTSIQVTAVGARGGGCGSGGRGASIAATVPVTPGEQLFVGVGGHGAEDCAVEQVSGAAGGVGGGGAGGNGHGGAGGFGGGGASLIATGSLSSPFSSPLVVAGGGGGAGGFTVGFPVVGGDAGSPGASNWPGGGGGGATASAGGPGGAGEMFAANNGVPNGANGADGGLGFGGTGGDGASNGGSGGGGGGGGYYGGGGGGGGLAGDEGSGGGGGSSFAVATASGVSGPTVTSAEPSVTIVYPVPTADQSTSSIAFGTQALDTAAPEQAVTVTNNGSAPLTVAGLLLTGADTGDYAISNRCQQPVSAGSSCQIGVRFAPQALGIRAAALTLLSNAATGSTPITLSGTGGPASQGTQGVQGPVTHPGPAGTVELVTCVRAITTLPPRHAKLRTIQQRCTAVRGTGAIAFTRGALNASVSRGRLLYATGTRLPAAGGGSTLVLTPRRALTRGRYTLTVTSVAHGHKVTHRTPIMLG